MPLASKAPRKLAWHARSGFLDEQLGLLLIVVTIASIWQATTSPTPSDKLAMCFLEQSTVPLRLMIQVLPALQQAKMQLC